MPFETDCSRHMGNYREVLMKSLRGEIKESEEGERTKERIAVIDIKKNEKEKAIITKKKRRITYKNADRQIVEYENSRHEQEMD